MTSNNKKKNGKLRSIFHGILIVILCLILAGGTAAHFMLDSIIGEVSDVEDKLESMIFNVEPTTIYDAKGEIISEVGAESREIVTYDQIPQVTIDAFLAIEDSRYFSHNGFDLPRFISSAFNNLRSGSLSQGGSTLTMQTIDNFLIKPKEEKAMEEGVTYSKLDRITSKLQEIYLALRLDSKMSKEDIFINYLNKINFGSSARGIQRGAQYYFGKNVEQLNLSESAFLAGVINAPYTNNPYQGYDAKTGQNFYQYATNRRNATLAQMLNHGYISETEYNLAKSCKLAFQLNGETNGQNNPYQAYILAAIREARILTGEDPATTPMKIYTALDLDAQNAVNDIMSKSVITMPDNPYYQVATSIIDNKTGEVVAIGTGFDDPYSSSYKDRAILEKHQPGSTVKPLVDYAMAFDKIGWATSRIVEDKPIKIYGSTKKNYNGQYYGKVSIERAIAQSLNIPAFITLEAVVNEVGYDYMKKYLSKLGFDKAVADKFDLLYAIGGANFITSPTQMAAAYSMFANQGKYVEPHLVRSITYKDQSKKIKTPKKETQVISPQAAYMVSDLLHKAIIGTWSGYNYMSSAFNGAYYPVYGKTGTSDWGDWSDQVGGSSQDGWMVNYTSEYTIASWNGFDSRVDGYTYLSDSVIDMNIPGRMNRYLFDTLTKDAQLIENPGGVSSFGGGLIKDEFLDKAGIYNPETTANMKDYSKDIKASISKAQEYDASSYTEKSFDALQSVINDAQAVLERGYIDKETANEMVDRINEAIDGLEKKETGVDTTDLEAAISAAQAYTDSALYDAKYVNNLNEKIREATEILSDIKHQQSQINSATQAIQEAIDECMNHSLQSSDE